MLLLKKKKKKGGLTDDSALAPVLNMFCFQSLEKVNIDHKMSIRFLE